MFLSSTALIEESIYSFGETLYKFLKYIKYITYFFFLCIIVYSYVKQNLKRVPTFLVLFFAGVSSLLTRDFQVLSFALVTIAATGISNKKFFKAYVIFSFSLLVIVLFLSSIGLIENVIYDLGSRNRNTLGFLWTTNAPMFFFFTILAVLYRYHKKLSWIELLSLWLINILLFQLTNTKFVFFLTSLSLFLEVIFSKYEDSIYKIFEKKWVKYTVCNIPGICCLFSLLSSLLFNPNSFGWQFLNSLLTNRLVNGHNAISQYGFSIFGQPIEWNGYWIGSEATDIYNYVDSSFLQIAIKDGLIIMLISIIAYMGILYWGIKKKSYWLVTITILVLILCVTEPRLINVSYNPFLIFSTVMLNNLEHADKRDKGIDNHESVN